MLNINEMKYEEAFKEINTIADEISAGEIPLDKAIEKYSRAVELVAFCDGKLNDAKAEVERLVSVLDEKTEVEETNVENLSFEEALAEAEELDGKMARGEIPFDDLLTVFARIVKLVLFCNYKLNKAREEMQIVKV